MPKPNIDLAVQARRDNNERAYKALQNHPMGERKLNPVEMDGMAWWFAYSNLGMDGPSDIIGTTLKVGGMYPMEISLLEPNDLAQAFKGKLMNMAESDRMWRDFQAEFRSWKKDLSQLSLVEIAKTWRDMSDILEFFANRNS